MIRRWLHNAGERVTPSASAITSGTGSTLVIGKLKIGNIDYSIIILHYYVIAALEHERAHVRVDSAAPAGSRSPAIPRTAEPNLAATLPEIAKANPEAAECRRELTRATALLDVRPRPALIRSGGVDSTTSTRSNIYVCQSLRKPS
jgi:hypothetical protein